MATAHVLSNIEMGAWMGVGMGAFGLVRQGLVLAGQVFLRALLPVMEGMAKRSPSRPEAAPLPGLKGLTRR
jgi:hypothetical protein